MTHAHATALSGRCTVVVLVCFLLTFGRGMAACSCNYGSVDIETPQCICACYADYLQPRCLYTADMMVPVGVWLSYPTTNFSSYAFEQTLTAALRIVDASSLKFQYARGSFNKTYVRCSMRGDYVQQFLWDFYSQNNWLGKYDIESVWEELSSPATSGVIEVDTTTVLFQSSDGKIIVTVGTLGWLFGAFVCALVVSCGDNLFLQNNEGDVRAMQALMDEQQHQLRIMRAQRRGVTNGEVRLGPHETRQIAVGPQSYVGATKNPFSYE